MDGLQPPSVQPLSSGSLCAFPSPAISSSPPPTDHIDSSWPTWTKRSPCCHNLIQSGMFEVLHRLGCWMLSGNSFQFFRTFFHPTETDNVRLDFSAVDEIVEVPEEKDLMECKKSLDIIIVFVRPLPLALITRLTHTPTIGSSIFRSRCSPRLFGVQTLESRTGWPNQSLPSRTPLHNRSQRTRNPCRSIYSRCSSKFDFRCHYKLRLEFRNRHWPDGQCNTREGHLGPPIQILRTSVSQIRYLPASYGIAPDPPPHLGLWTWESNVVHQSTRRIRPLHDFSWTPHMLFRDDSVIERLAGCTWNRSPILTPCVWLDERNADLVLVDILVIFSEAIAKHHVSSRELERGCPEM